LIPRDERLLIEMEQKRKIIIPLGGSREAIPARDFEGATTAHTPLFDAEATLGARPVVPLAETQKSRQLPLLALVVLLAISAGVAGGFAIGIYRSRQIQQSAAPDTAATTTINTDTATTAQAPAPAQQLPAAVASEKTPEPERTAASNAPTERTVRDNKPKRDEEQVIPPVEVRERGKEKKEREDRAREDRDREESIARDEERELRRQQRRERRRRARDMDEANGDVNQQIERGARELNRIREIFEGQRP
jgi:type IV secretory pathway VirB10-like protein